jgi:hypothetical protein
MTATRSVRAELSRIPAVDSFEEIREAFCVRMQSERLHFVALNEALGMADHIPAPILNALRNRAHRLSGTAAIFEFAGIAAAARKLELTATSASYSHIRNSKPGVCTALASLVRLIGSLKKSAIPA